MASVQRDISLAVMICCVGYLTARLIHKQLLAVQKVTLVTYEPTSGPERQDEDALKLETLEKLIPNANRDIAGAAIKILAERAIRGRTYELLLRHIMGDDAEKRDKALISLCYLHERVDDKIAKLNYPTLKAIICCLTKSQMQAEAVEFERKFGANIPAYRSPHYNDALHLLHLIISNEDNVREALRAGLITEWLRNYPWHGGAGPEIVKKRMRWPHNDFYMRAILSATTNDKRRGPGDRNAGIAQLVDYGLLDDIGRDEDISGEALRRLRMREYTIDLTQSAPTTPLSQTSVPIEHGTNLRGGLQTREESPEEQMLRRRRREAMVFENEGEPLSSASIIERVPESERIEIMNQSWSSEVSDTARRFREMQRERDAWRERSGS